MGKNFRFLLLSILALSCVAFSACNYSASTNERSIKTLKNPSVNTPVQVVRNYWELSLNGDFSEANKLTSPASTDYIDWRHHNRDATPPSVVKESSESTDMIYEDMTNVDQDYFKLIITWSSLIKQRGIRIKRLFPVGRKEDKIQIDVETTLDGSGKGVFTLSVLLRNIKGEWKIYAIWDN